MIVNLTNVSPPSSRNGRRLFRRSSLVAAVALAVVLSAGVVLAQVLHQPKLAPTIAPQAPMGPPAPIKFDTVTIQRGDIQQIVEAAGKLQLYKYADANAQVIGQIKDVLVSVGDTVQMGKLLVEITPTLQPAKAETNRAQMARLQAELADQRAQMDFAELQFKRQTQLKAQNATREESFESSRMSMSSASARVDAINAQIRQVEATLKLDEDSRQHTQVVAPISGTVVALNARPGQMVGAPAPAVALMRIADLTKMTVQARVAEVDVTRLRRGMIANFTTPGYPGKQWSGKLRQVIPVPADGTGEQGKQTFYNVLFEVDNPEQELMSGMSTQVQFIVSQAKAAVLLPIKLLGETDDDGFYNANVLDADQQLSRRKLKIGIRNQHQVQVISGLAVGDQLLVGPIPAVLLKPKQPSPPASPAASTLLPAAPTVPANPTGTTSTPKQGAAAASFSTLVAPSKGTVPGAAPSGGASAASIVH
ncbi:efflux RND transporter periplasmic adaptor subunit [Glaciimonas immobilis]|uniref:Macrolide-specific efflux system membrane fusion protein n=1 Tax=Glaciimonas immobilis TaxID=728004 RepID=A0A840RP07_9BURK|nr:efflux RND transporter periplasmic adaptor subunit [Glaciimonas immobilis]KAF3997901.1 efflux RND transporter periplasmic adaptor subunit [Glaciimonas immobilis]MBB5199445.1 macrolide-specific efflux system membrane fusion protein [Glaciimonas immobilis]